MSVDPDTSCAVYCIEDIGPILEEMKMHDPGVIVVDSQGHHRAEEKACERIARCWGHDTGASSFFGWFEDDSNL